MSRDVKRELHYGEADRNGASYRDTKVVEDRLILHCSYRFVGGIATAISVVCFPFLSPAFRKICLPYVPATRQQIKNVIRALNGRSGSLIDLGSGDGRIVLAAAKRGFKAHGIELNTWLVWYSRLQALINGLSSETAFLKQDLWKHHLGNYDNVVIFGVDQMSFTDGRYRKEVQYGVA
ncbi:ATP synthase subunit C lysine N-methyltransferase isoform X3 [Temnothorax americanus]|uniref:ATP synthase subunit C lysine N-methyltransferase isoform X3 n=1 Tax=Temnothorax americanus TaxID=1964332 RepID=UPI004068EAB0